MLINHNFCRSGIWGQLSWFLQLRVSQKAVIKVSARAVVSQKGSTVEDPLLVSLRWLLAGFSSLLTVGWRSPLVLSQSSPQVSSQHGGWLPPDQVSKKVREVKQIQNQSLFTLNLGSDIPGFLLYFLYQKQVTRSSSH